MTLQIRTKGFMLGLQSMISHNISQSVNADSSFDVDLYIEEVSMLFIQAGMDEVVITEIVQSAKQEGLMDYAMALMSGYGSAQMTPATAYERAITQYKTLTGGIQS